MADQANHHRYGEKSDRQRMPAIINGLKCRCPACGEGRLFSRYLKTVDACAACGTEIHHHRADDLPAYLVILILGHFMVGGYMTGAELLDVPDWVHLAIWVPLTAIAAFAIIQPIKGAVVGLQWALKMHGFDGKGDDQPAEY
ncbi:DUF983 domain-containing protein [Martelella mediterranea]|uniref:Zinc-finger protein n=1 Tax=Martelella mediterranea DSM 17316 TaxID=1122214 RepID=A0A1U9Z535_9HYPH|nr:DUF983 domain-containing protein [Martelella mediterranea]AQZ52712.1 hypothetical protein Mame_03405 [Martelella mediterranea DSM 17316]